MVIIASPLHSIPSSWFISDISYFREYKFLSYLKLTSLAYVFFMTRYWIEASRSYNVKVFPPGIFTRAMRRKIRKRCELRSHSTHKNCNFTLPVIHKYVRFPQSMRRNSEVSQASIVRDVPPHVHVVPFL